MHQWQMHQWQNRGTKRQRTLSAFSCALWWEHFNCSLALAFLKSVSGPGGQGLKPGIHECFPMNSKDKSLFLNPPIAQVWILITPLNAGLSPSGPMSRASRSSGISRRPREGRWNSIQSCSKHSNAPSLHGFFPMADFFFFLSCSTAFFF